MKRWGSPEGSSPVLQSQQRYRHHTDRWNTSTSASGLVFGVGFFSLDSCVEITAWEVSLILWDVKVLSWSVLPHHREHKFGKMKLTEQNAVKKRDWQCLREVGPDLQVPGWTWYGKMIGAFRSFYQLFWNYLSCYNASLLIVHLDKHSKFLERKYISFKQIVNYNPGENSL